MIAIRPRKRRRFERRAKRVIVAQRIEIRIVSGECAVLRIQRDRALEVRHCFGVLITLRVRDEDPDNDHAIYMLAVAHAQRDEHAEAVAHLERAIALNPENRALARNDPDLEPLRDDDAFRAALEPLGAVATEAA